MINSHPRCRLRYCGNNKRNFTPTHPILSTHAIITSFTKEGKSFTMLYTSAEAAKLLRSLNDKLSSLEAQENMSSTFRAAITENVEDARPAYDYAATQAALQELEAKIRTLKHAINTFNLSQEVPGFDMTIDQMLVYIPQLTKRKAKLQAMKDRLPKTREYIRVAGIIEYSYANYDVDATSRDYDATADELSRAQTALDVVNNSVKFEIDI